MTDVGTLIVCAAVSLLILVVYLRKGLQDSRKTATTIPGPQPVDALKGNFPNIAACGSFHQFLLDLHRTYGDIASFWWGPKLTVSIASPELFRQHSKPFDRPPELFELFKPLVGENCIQYVNGDEGKRRHDAYRRCYTTGALDIYCSIFTQLSKEFLKKWDTCADKEEHIPLRESMLAFGIKSMLKTSYGRFFDSDEQVMAVLAAYHYCWAEMGDRLRGDLPEANSERLNRFEKQKAVLYGLLKQAMEYRKDHPPSAGEHLLIDAILQQDMSDTANLQDMVGLLVGGSHTTGLLLTWVFYFLASNAHMQTKVVEEIWDVLGEEDVSAESTPHLIYLRQVIDETLRQTALSPIATRVQDIDIQLGGHHIPAGTPVVHALGVVHQNPKVYPDPERFDPDRFSAEATKDRPPCSFEPFGFAGKRKCPGYRFSLAEVSVFITSVLKRFEIKLVPGQIVIPTYELVATPKEEIWITVEKRVM